jgi:hypothetical protein
MEVEAVLCEDHRSVALYHYQGDELLRITHQALPLKITEAAFEDVRCEWEGRCSSIQTFPTSR